MTLNDYLRFKYVDRPRGLLACEAKALGIAYPLEAGWLRKHGATTLTPQNVAALRGELLRSKRPTAPQSLDALRRCWPSVMGCGMP